ncbi:MAG: AMP-binding protein, partial [Sneathiellales bacterium]|nr:AMP-binding protein [Sneathiellales bacterium]
AIKDPVAEKTSGAQEIGFDRDAHPNCSTILWDNLERNPDKLALTGPAGDMTYRELISEAARWGNAFKKAGLNRGERIAFFLEDTPVYPAAFFGAVRAGFVPVLLNTQTKPDIVKYFLQDMDARFCLCEADLVSHLSEEILTDTKLQNVIIVNGEARGEKQIAAAAFLKDQELSLDCADTGPEDMAFWMYSSGSTGKPKGIVHLHHDMAYTQQSFGKHILQLKKEDICFSVPKIFFAYGFGNALTFPFSVGATTVLLAGQPRPDRVLDIIETYKPSVLFGLPTLYTALAKDKSLASRDLSSLRQSMSAAEILSEEVYNQWKTAVGHGPTEGLGSTELLHVYLSNSLEEHHIGAAGKPVPGYEIRLETPEGELVAPGQEGVMLVRGDSSAPLYWNRPDKTKETMRDDWIHTG